jgi:hypothetical protein
MLLSKFPNATDPDLKSGLGNGLFELRCLFIFHAGRALPEYKVHDIKPALLSRTYFPIHYSLITLLRIYVVSVITLIIKT